MDQNKRAYAFINQECKIVLADCSETEENPVKTFLDGWSHFSRLLPDIRTDQQFGDRQRN